MLLDGSKAQRIRQGAEYQLAQKQAIGPSHDEEEYPARQICALTRSRLKPLSQAAPTIALEALKTAI